MTAAAVKLPAKKPNIDPKRVADRVYAQLDKLLTRLETDDEKDEDAITTPQLINAIKMIAQVMILQANLRAKDVNDPSSPGSAVRKYSQAFKTNAARGGAIVTGPGANDIFDDDD